VIVLRGYGALVDPQAGAGMVMPLLLPDAPVVAWWPSEAPVRPSDDPVGRLAQRRITDALSAKNPIKAFEQRRANHVAGDTDLTWTRLTSWRALLATSLDAPPHEPVLSAVVAGEVISPSTDLLAGWLAARLDVKVKRSPAKTGEGMVAVRLERRSGPVELIRPDGKVGRLRQPGQPDRLVALARREVRDCIAEELRRLDPDEIYAAALGAVGQVSKGRTPIEVPALAGV
jgi:glucose-6-phosphate dehydrogenase assembly protein OpcA